MYRSCIYSCIFQTSLQIQGPLCAVPSGSSRGRLRRRLFHSRDVVAIVASWKRSCFSWQWGRFAEAEVVPVQLFPPAFPGSSPAICQHIHECLGWTRSASWSQTVRELADASMLWCKLSYNREPDMQSIEVETVENDACVEIYISSTDV